MFGRTTCALLCGQIGGTVLAIYIYTGFNLEKKGFGARGETVPVIYTLSLSTIPIMATDHGPREVCD